jgi:hypothetical protein
LMGFEDFTTDRPPNAVGPVLRKVDGRVRPAAAAETAEVSLA